MDPAAELTLRLIRTGQEALGPKSSRVGWFIYPDIRHVPWEDARALLADAPKPVMAAALIEPGLIAWWKRGELDLAGQQSLDDQLRNQCSYFDSKLDSLGLTLADEVETPDQQFRLSVADFKRWVREYCITAVGVGLGTSLRPRTARIHIRAPGGHLPPIGWDPPAT